MIRLNRQPCIRLALSLLIWTGVVQALSVSEARAAASLTYVVSVGNNLGHAGETPLRYAERDASEFAETMRTLGDVPSQNAVLVQGESATTLRKILVDTNRRIRAAISRGIQNTTLLVYYSGHANNNGLHLGPTTLAFDEFKSLVESSPATVRVMLLDSCRSGGVTRVKGVVPAQAFDIQVQNKMVAEGLAVITSSAASEDSHESEQLRGSFFTHHLLSGLRGGADHNHDGLVTLNEVYSYAYQQTLRSSGQTMSLQHPTYEYDIKGKGDLILTQLQIRRGRLASLLISTPGLYLIMEGRESGHVISEVMVGSKGASLQLAPGDYFVQRRARDHYLEYDITLRASQETELATAASKQIDYARLVRKGSAQLPSLHGLYIMSGARGEILAGQGPSLNLIAGYTLDLAWLSFGLRGRWTHATNESWEQTLDTQHDEISVGAVAQRYIDLPWFSVGVGLLTETTWYRQSFTTTGVAPARNSWGFGFGGIVSAEYAFSGPFIARIEGGPVAHIFQKGESDAGAQTDARVATPVTWWTAAGVGWRF